MVKNALEAAIVFVQGQDDSLDCLSDLDSFSLFLNTNDFLPEEISVDTLYSLINRRKKMSFAQSKKTLSQKQARILERFISVYKQIQLLPTLDDDITAFENDLALLEEQTPDVSYASSEKSNQVIDIVNPVSHFQDQLAILQDKEQTLLEKQEALFAKEQFIQTKEYALQNKVLSISDPRVREVMHRLDQKMHHLQALEAEYNNHERNWESLHAHHEQRKKHFERTILELSAKESHFQQQLVLRKKELESLESTFYGKAKDLRDAEKQLLQTQKRITRIEGELSKRESFILAKEKELEKQEHKLEDSWEKLHDLKDEVIAKQHSVAQKEISLVKNADKKEQELVALYTSRIKELEREYSKRLSTLDRELDSVGVKKAHLAQKEALLDNQQSLLEKERREIKLLKTKYELQVQNNLAAVTDIRNPVYVSADTSKQNAKPLPASHAKETKSESLDTIETLIDVATSEISLNPNLAKRTYKRIHELYQHLPFSEQTTMHKKIVSLHSQIHQALVNGGSK